MKIDLSSDRLIAIAADLVEEHNFIGALKMLNKMRSATSTTKIRICFTLKFSTIWGCTKNV